MLPRTSSGDKSLRSASRLFRVALGTFFGMEFEKDDDIATPAAALPWKAAFTHFDGLTRIGVRGDLDDQRFPVEVFEFDGRAQQGVGISERQGHDEVGACSFKPRVRLNFDLNEQIARLAHALRSGFALSTHSQTGAVFDPLWHAEPNGVGFELCARFHRSLHTDARRFSRALRNPSRFAALLG